jgi:hypothetical protein
LDSLVKRNFEVLKAILDLQKRLKGKGLMRKVLELKS